MTEATHEPREYWITKPTEDIQGLRVAELGSDAYIELVDDNGVEKRSVLVESHEIDDLISVLVEISNRTADLEENDA